MTMPDLAPEPKAEPEVKHDPKRRALGRGLEALLPARPAPPAAPPPQPGGKPLEIPIGNVERNPFQTRTAFDEEKLMELARSIAASGVIQAVTVRPLGDGRFQLISGERRLLASLQAGKTTIPAMVLEVSDEQAMEMTIVENLQRADLNPMEQARAFVRLATEFKMTQEQMALRTGKDRATIGNFVRLFRLPEPVQGYLESGELSFGHARSLLGLPSHEQMSAVADRVLAQSLSVRQTELHVQAVLYPEKKLGRPPKVPPRPDPNVGEAQDRLQRALGLKVRIEDKRGKGRVIIEYSGLEDFDSLMSALSADE